ncbi:NHL repeat-containing protein, partial [Oscillatoriales cyanobacterium LEGE 11467]
MRVLKPFTLAIATVTGLVMGATQADAVELYVSSFNNDSVLRFDGDTGAFIDTFVPEGSGGLDGPVSLTFGPDDNNLYVISFLTNSVLRYDNQTGNFIDEFVSSGSGNLFFPQDLTFGLDANLYVSNTGNDSVNQYDGATGAFLEEFVPNPNNPTFLNAPFGVRFGPDDNFYFTSTFTNSLLRFDPTASTLETLATLDPGTFPGGIAFGPDGNLYIANFGANSIDRYNFETDRIEPFVLDIDSPVQPIFGPDGNLYVSSNSTGKGITVAGSVFRFDGRTGEAIDEFIPTGTGGLDGAGWL